MAFLSHVYELLKLGRDSSPLSVPPQGHLTRSQLIYMDPDVWHTE